MLSFDRLKLDGDFLPGDDVDSEVDVTCEGRRNISPTARKEIGSRRTKGARANLLAQSVLAADTEVETVRGRIGHRCSDQM